MTYSQKRKREQTNKSALATIFWSANNTSLSRDNKNAATTDHTKVSGTTSVLPPVTTTSVLPPVSTTSVLPPVTTKSQLTIGINISACSCANSYCLSMNRTLLTEIELAEKLLALTKDIAVNRIETSLYKNTKISAYDPRKSSTYLSIDGIIIILLPFIFIVIIDILRFFKD
ncbi:unnamed protein product [Mytilus edulis]|uniref:Uncharacterized protein n=1 Tax=Mytilus edulis TaxID=6550 RepID=A0A8S3SJG7_MYTED|nr:unnamed protein product [Mytilus edulis]